MADLLSQAALDKSPQVIDSKAVPDAALQQKGEEKASLAGTNLKFVPSDEKSDLSPGQKIWNNFVNLKNAEIDAFKQTAKQKWGVTANNWYIYRIQAMRSYYMIYEHIYNIGFSKSLSPNFLHAVVMGEDLYRFSEEMRAAGKAYDRNEEIDSYQYLGLDNIGTNIDKLIADGYADASTRTKIKSYESTNEKGEKIVTAKIIGYEAAIGLVAAELASRRDYILGKASANGLSITDSDKVDFITYATFNNISVGEDAIGSVEKLNTYTRPFDLSKEREDEQNVRFNTLKRLVVSEWYKLAKVYEI
jgi:hypothetical protein